MNFESIEKQHTDEAQRATAWLSRGLEALLAEIGVRRALATEERDFDVIIVGSGYGGAIALSRLAGWRENGRPLRIALLERGEEYLPGAFPGRFADLPGHVRMSTPGEGTRGMRQGLFDIRVGPDLQAIIANGLGGGSLINAGVMALPHESVFEHSLWPVALRASAQALIDAAPGLKRELGAEVFAKALPKQVAMDRLSGGLARPLDITVANRAGPNVQGVELEACLACGDCFTGCNHGAKASLDVTLLVDGRRHAGVEIYTGATVLRVQSEAGGWRVVVVHTQQNKRRREGAPLSLRAQRVILSAGAFGSTGILMRSRDAGLALSDLLGKRFSSNGDAMSTIYDMHDEAFAVADESEHWGQRRCGPTIVACHDVRRGDPATDYVVQDISVPGPLRRAFEQISITADALATLGEADNRVHAPGIDHPDPNAVDPERIRRSLLVATMSHDNADGHLVLGPDDGDEPVPTVEWPDLRHDPRFAQRHRALEHLARTGTGGRVLANPAWRAFPEAMAHILDAPLGAPITVHPLGGCSMGERGGAGVVDDLGRVFAGAGTERHEGLLVLDGSIVPTSLGINPALTIALIADRAVRALREDAWGLQAPEPAVTETLVFPRPIYRRPAAPAPARETRVVIAEKLLGTLTLARKDGPCQRHVELELVSEPVALSALMAPNGPRTIKLDAKLSEARVFEENAADDVGAYRLDGALEKYSLSGSLTLFGHAPSTPLQRRGRALWAWLRNRGFRDIVQELRTKVGGTDTIIGEGLSKRARWAFALASRAGDARTLVYDLWMVDENGAESAITGVKTLTYSYGSNPWTQLMEVTLRSFPGWTPRKDESTLRVDLTYFEKARTLLLKIVDAEDLPSALADLGAFGAWLLRIMLHVHVWSFRKPDPPPAREPRRLPGLLPGLPPPEVIEFEVHAAPTPDGAPVLARLSRYRGDAATRRTPILMIHGYSASGTTFAHPAIPGNGLAGHLCARGHDAWVLDLRSSCGMPAARHRWRFEQIGYTDIPLAVEHVMRVTGAGQVDLVAHCMGAAMLCMALFGEWPAAMAPDDPQLALRRLLPERIRRLVLSQMGPKPVMSPANVSRAYAMRFLQHYFRLEEYAFRPDLKAGAAAQMLDRLLATVPYPPGEFRLENPLWPPGASTPWVSTRHRMDALYGATFALDNMTPVALDHIDDFFGPFNARTLTQVIHFTRGFRLADARGRSLYEDESIVRERVRFPVLSLHSLRNGLVDAATSRTTAKFFSISSHGHRSIQLECGHQDALIGRRAAQTFSHIADFLEVP